MQLIRFKTEEYDVQVAETAEKQRNSAKLDLNITTLLTAVISIEGESNILCSINTFCSHNLLLYH